MPISARWRCVREPAAGRAIQERSCARWAAAAKDAGRVEVPFSMSSPRRENEWWSTDSRGGIDVPLGRAGATKLQHLDLGHGTSQHVLISGKTGSGKSTLLHVLITNMALHYSPEEVELYLVDFKKGVEFKAYARTAAARSGSGHRERARVRPERAATPRRRIAKPRRYVPQTRHARREGVPHP